mgnify:CR=1 FL=1|jgi:hypothetical protein
MEKLVDENLPTFLIVQQPVAVLGTIQQFTASILYFKLLNTIIDVAK